MHKSEPASTWRCEGGEDMMSRTAPRGPTASQGSMSAGQAAATRQWQDALPEKVIHWALHRGHSMCCSPLAADQPCPTFPAAIHCRQVSSHWRASKMGAKMSSQHAQTLTPKNTTPCHCGQQMGSLISTDQGTQRCREGALHWVISSSMLTGGCCIQVCAAVPASTLQPGASKSAVAQILSS